MKYLFFILTLLTGNYCFGQYNFYFGNLHAHSAYSDGNKDSVNSGFKNPGDDFYYAKGSYQMDFMGISDHNHYNANNNPGMRLADFTRGMQQADTANKEGTFVSLYGMEWGVINNGGHLITYGIPALVGWESGLAWGNNYTIFCDKYDYTNFWSIINSYPAAFCTLAHPQSGDYNDLLGSATLYDPAADNAIAGTAIRSGGAFSTTTDYTDPAPTLYESTYLTALAKGYHIGPTADQDNHYTTFGRSNRIRTVVLATTLSRDSIMSAYKAMRFYASDDWNTQVNFTVNGYYMGSDISTGLNTAINVTVTDPDVADNVSKIDIYYGIPGSGTKATVLTSSNSNTLNYTHPTGLLSRYYYFAKVTQADGDIIWTSPVWVYRELNTVPVALSFFGGRQQNKQVALDWTTAQEFNNDHFNIERSSDGIHYKFIGTINSKYKTTATATSYNFSDIAPSEGMNFYRLKQVDADGNFSYSNIVAVNFFDPAIQITSINPNPVLNNLVLVCTAEKNETVTCKIYSNEGREVKNISAYLNKGLNTINTDVSTLAPGFYFIVISKPNKRITESRFIKQ